MATIAMMIGGALVNALAFSGSNWLFSSLRGNQVDEERLRHDKAVEQLNAAHEAWSRKRTERLDWLNQQIQRERHSVSTFRDVNAALSEYAQVFGKDKADAAAADLREPVLSDYYTPSDDHKTRELVFVGIGCAAAGVIAWKLFD
jgi:hypothetical protein